MSRGGRNWRRSARRVRELVRVAASCGRRQGGGECAQHRVDTVRRNAGGTGVTRRRTRQRCCQYRYSPGVHAYTPSCSDAYMHAR